LGSGAPIGRVPVTRPRRDRVMGSSILASLSEAGGNDPHGVVSKPLPPHSLRPADRVERDPRPFSLQTRGPKRAVLREQNYAEFTGVSRRERAQNMIATCRSGNRRPNEENAPDELHLRTANTPERCLRGASPRDRLRIPHGTISRATHPTWRSPDGVRLLNRAPRAAWSLRECGS